MITENSPTIPARNKLPGEKPVLPGTTIGGELGTFFVDFVLWDWQMERSRTLNGLVDTGATFPQAPASILEEPGIERMDTVRFRLADGSSVERPLGRVVIEAQGLVRPVSVIFGPENSSVLLGALALEECGLAADARNRRLISADIPQ
jgi:predicted aspartyl protease